MLNDAAFKSRVPHGMFPSFFGKGYVLLTTLRAAASDRCLLNRSPCCTQYGGSCRVHGNVVRVLARTSHKADCDVSAEELATEVSHG